MPDTVIPLSKGNIRHLIRDLKEFSRALREDIPTDIERATGAVVASLVQNNIAGIADVDGNYLGTDNPNASVTVEVALSGHEVIWRGKQIAFVEFGTGAAGASGGYPGLAMAAAGYHPDPTKTLWVFKDAKTGEARISTGLSPQAPMLNAVMAFMHGDPKAPARSVLKGAIRRALTV